MAINFEYCRDIYGKRHKLQFGLHGDPTQFVVLLTLDDLPPLVMEPPFVGWLRRTSRTALLAADQRYTEYRHQSPNN